MIKFKDNKRNCKKNWRVLKFSEENGFMNMAIDEAILNARIKGLVPNTLRFYSWNPSCISIGYFQSVEKEVDLEKAKDLGVNVVRRITGGGAVFHEKELTYSIFLSEKDASRDIVESYRNVCSGIIYGLGFLGLNAEFKPINDIIVDNKKISGNAQTRRDGVILQHGTILLDVDVKKMFSLLKVPDEKIKDKLISSVEERVTSLKKILGKDIKPEVLRELLINGFEQAFNAHFEERELTKFEIELAKKLFKEKYSKKYWNFLR